MVNKEKLIKLLSKKTDYSQTDIEVVLDALQEVTYETIANGEDIKLMTGLTLEVVDTKGGTRRNPMTGQTFEKEAGKKVKATLTNKIKDLVK